MEHAIGTEGDDVRELYTAHRYTAHKYTAHIQGNILGSFVNMLTLFCFCGCGPKINQRLVEMPHKKQHACMYIALQCNAMHGPFVAFNIDEPLY